MVESFINIEGDADVKVYLDGVARRTKIEKDLLPRQVAFAIKRGVKRQLLKAPYSPGAYHRITGGGLSKALQVRKIGDGLYTMRPDPALPAVSTKGTGSRGGIGFIDPPQVYADFVEERKGYFAKGFRNSIRELNGLSEKTANRIIRG